MNNEIIKVLGAPIVIGRKTNNCHHKNDQQSCDRHHANDMAYIFELLFVKSYRRYEVTIGQAMQPELLVLAVFICTQSLRRLSE